MNPFLTYPHCSCKLSITHQALWVTQRRRRTTAETSMLQPSIKKQGSGVGREGEWSLEALGEDLFGGRGVGLGRGGQIEHPGCSWVCCGGERWIWRWVWAQKLRACGWVWRSPCRHVQKLNDGPGGATSNREQIQRQNLLVTDFL